MNDLERQQTKAVITKELNRAKRIAAREVIKVETELIDTLDTVQRYVKKHPLQAAAVTLSLGAAIGAAGALYVKRKSR